MSAPGKRCWDLWDLRASSRRLQGVRALVFADTTGQDFVRFFVEEEGGPWGCPTVVGDGAPRGRVGAASHCDDRVPVLARPAALAALGRKVSLGLVSPEGSPGRWRRLLRGVCEWRKLARMSHFGFASRDTPALVTLARSDAPRGLCDAEQGGRGTGRLPAPAPAGV